MNEKEVFENINKALEEIRPYLKADGGDIKLVSFDEETVTVKFEGACVDCKINHLTLKNGVEATIKKYVPQIRKIIEQE